MKLELNSKQLELLKYMVLWYESNDKEEEELCQQIEAKIYHLQEKDVLRLISSQNVI